MATHGTIGKFDSCTEDWASYTERLTEYFTANDVKSADKKGAILALDHLLIKSSGTW